MEKKEKNFEGTVLNGFLMLFVNLVLTLGCLPLFVYSCILLDGGDGTTMFQEDEVILDSGLPDYQVLVNYIVSLDGDLSAYAEPQGRITVK